MFYGWGGLGLREDEGPQRTSTLAGARTWDPSVQYCVGALGALGHPFLLT